MYYRDHAPPHFHAIYGEQEAVVEIPTTNVLEGGLSRRAQALVTEWATAHANAHNWDLARAGQPLQAIDPLD
jgi:hypothetical protein